MFLAVSGNAMQAEELRAEIAATEMYIPLQLSFEAFLLSIGIYIRSARRNLLRSLSNASDFLSYFNQD
jgi:hypothetical protein